MTEMTKTIFTIGHSTHSLEDFLGLLKQHGVTALVDVRSTPYSRFNPQFDKDSLERSLRSAGIEYVFLGHELGARSNDPSCYLNGRVQYKRLAQTELFRSGIERVIRGARGHRIVLMCAEKEPLECHRTLLVARALDERGVAVVHILGDGRIESHHDAMRRLLDVTGVPPQDLFRSQDELIEEALSQQERKVAYIDAKLAAEGSGGKG